MTMLAAFVMMQATRSASIEVVPSGDASVIRADIFVRRKKGGPLDDAVENVLGELIGEGSADYGAFDFRELTGDSGFPLMVETVPAGIHIQFGIRSVDQASLAGMVENLLEKTSISDDAVAKAVQRIQHRQPSIREQLFSPWALPYGDIRTFNAVDAYRRQFQPQNISITLSAAPQYASLASEIKLALSNYPAASGQGWKPDPLPYKLAASTSDVLPAAVLGSPVLPKSPDFPKFMLAMICLGAGKGSLIWKGLRLDKRWSYLQEADLIPEPEGLAPVVFFMDAASDPDVLKKQAQMQDLLLDMAGKLTQADLERAQAYSQSVFDRGYGMSPLHLLSKNDPPDALYLDSLWRSYGADDPHLAALADAMKSVTLDQLKEEVTGIIKSCKARPLPTGS